MTIVITSKHDGFRRCGIAHSSKVVRYPDDFFSEEQLRALSKEPQLILGYEEDEFDQVQGHRDESLQEVDVSKASDTAQNTQPQTLEAIAATLGDAVVLPVTSVVGSGGSGSNSSGSGPIASVIEQVHGQPTPSEIDLDALWEEARQEDQAREAVKAGASEIDLDVLWEEARQEDQVRETVKAEAAKPPAKPGKPKTAKAEGEGK